MCYPYNWHWKSLPAISLCPLYENRTPWFCRERIAQWFQVLWASVKRKIKRNQSFNLWTPNPQPWTYFIIYIPKLSLYIKTNYYPVTKLVIPAAAERRAGIQKRPCDNWIPAFARMTGWLISDGLFNCQVNNPAPAPLTLKGGSTWFNWNNTPLSSWDVGFLFF